MLSENTCFHFLPLILSAVSTTGRQRERLLALTKLVRVDVCKFGTVTVSSTRELLLVVVEIASGESIVSDDSCGRLTDGQI
jgi:hypothetical protein